MSKTSQSSYIRLNKEVRKRLYKLSKSLNIPASRIIENLIILFLLSVESEGLEEVLRQLHEARIEFFKEV